MKNLKRMMSLVLALVICMSLCVTAFASESEVLPLAEIEYTSKTRPIPPNGGTTYTYTGYSSLYVGGSRYRAAAWIQSDTGRVPAGYMGANARVFNGNARLLDDTGMIYNTVSDYFIVAAMNNTVYSANGAYSQGEYKCFNGDDYNSGDLYETKYVPPTRALLADQLKDENYPVSSLGKTYGSALLAETVGYEPDLITAVGTKGQDGYVKREDLQGPEIHTPEEAVTYMQTRPESYTVPLYNLQEEVIGEFKISNALEITGCTLEEAKEMVAFDTGSSVAQLVERTTLVNGDYPRNSRGETYGNHFMAQELGYEADLQAAVGTEGQEGYVRREDRQGPKIRTPEEAVAYMKSRPDSWKIPLYDFQGNVIGEFEIGGAMRISDCTLEEAEVLAASGTSCR